MKKQKDKRRPVKKLIIRKMKSTDDYRAVCKLIYKTDDIIYPDLLGKNKEIAYEVLKKLLNDPDSLFYYKNYYVAEYEGEIIGIAALHKKTVKWKPNTVIRAFNELQKDPPGKFKNVSKYYKGVYNKSQSKHMKLRNVSVKNRCQKKGVGSKIVQHIIKEHEGSSIELWVQVTNCAALELYNKSGFEKEGQDILDYGGYVEQKVLCRRMVRY